MKTSNSTVNNILALSKTLSFLTDTNTRYKPIECVKIDMDSLNLN